MQKKKGHTDAGMESRMKSRKKVSYILLGAAVFLGAVLGIQYGRQRQLQQEIAEKIVRFHVRANSDSEEDQQLKLAVRDAVGSLMGGRLAGVSDKTVCEDKIEESLGRGRDRGRAGHCRMRDMTTASLRALKWWIFR